MQFGAIEATGLVDGVRDQLRRSILGGGLRPGAVLRESVIAGEMGISRAPVREALRLLEDSGLVTKKVNKPYVVADFTHDDLVDLASLRISLEELATRLVVGRVPDVSGAEKALGDMQRGVAEGSTYHVIAADRAFHEALVVAAGNPRLNDAYSRLRDQIELGLVSNVRQASATLDGIYERHVDFLARYQRAVEFGDPTDFVPLLHDHASAGLGVRHSPRWLAGGVVVARETD